MSGFGMLLLFLIVCIHGLATYVLLEMRREMTDIRTFLERTLKPWPLVAPPGATSFHSHPNSIYAIWIYKGRCWELDLSSVPAGYSAGSPPKFAGSFEGQRIKSECKRC